MTLLPVIESRNEGHDDLLGLWYPKDETIEARE